MSTVPLEERVKESLERSEAAFKEGQPQFFDEFAKDAMIFTPDSADPIKGRDAYQQTYGSALIGQKRQKTILDRKLQIVGDRAVVTQKAQITQGEETVEVLQTIVYGLTDEGVKMLHHQTARAASTGAAGLVLPSVNVVNEKIASVAIVIGVAQ